MRFEPGSLIPRLLGNDGRPGNPSDARSDGFAGGCISLIVLLIEIPVALLLGLTSVLREWGRADEQAVPPMDWVPILWLGGFTLGVLVIAGIFLYAAHPFAGALQLLVAAIALLFTIAAWHNQYERAHPPPLPTKAGLPHALCRTIPGQSATSVPPGVSPPGVTDATAHTLKAVRQNTTRWAAGRTPRTTPMPSPPTSVI
ncbi:DUF6234 family protein [Streptomyces sp. ALI-76-A]|uniref:DUF6234 family protein n=1 Tax=Streptomyces sp. ALI-76-A TaxID=3025736 RepID=UPI00256EED7B|nr:DUF6234 family protein [Streptomyces sp. ALI-76-A]MDL5206244.1 DUF6234 family protein [Streptomyces sp. ALI-76-A]